MFGFIAAAATLGGILGGLLTASAVRALGVPLLLLGAALLLEFAVFAVRHLGKISSAMHDAQATPRREESHPIGGGVMAGLTNVLRSSYLLNICLYMLLYTILSTFLYFQQAAIVDANFVDRAARTAFFAKIDIMVNALTLTGQLFVTGAMLRLVGITMTLALVPALTVAGFTLLGLQPTMAVAVIFIVARRSTNFVFARPTREVLFTVVSREDKYKAKSFIDTVVYRLGDQIGAWSAGLLTWLSFGVSGIAWAAVPLALAWVVTAWWLGRRHEAHEPVLVS
jgi:AAA family ATP:ADP antiporter